MDSRTRVSPCDGTSSIQPKARKLHQRQNLTFTLISLCANPTSALRWCKGIYLAYYQQRRILRNNTVSFYQGKKWESSVITLKQNFPKIQMEKLDIFDIVCAFTEKCIAIWMSQSSLAIGNEKCNLKRPFLFTFSDPSISAVQIQDRN